MRRQSPMVVAMAWMLPAIGAWAQTQDAFPPLKWTARERFEIQGQPQFGVNADDQAMELGYWNQDPGGVNQHWIFVTGWVTELQSNNGPAKGKRFATYKYNGAANGTNGDLDPTAGICYPPAGTVINQGDTYKAVAIAAAPDGSVYVAGEGPHTPGSAGNQDYYIVAYNSNLQQQWVATYEGPVGGNDVPADIAVDSANQIVVVTGTSPGSGTGLDIATVALNTSDGSRAIDQWPNGVRRYNHGAVNGDDRAVELGPVTVSEEGQPASRRLTVILVGTSWGGAAAEDDFATLLYNRADMNQDAVARFDLGGADVATGIAFTGAFVWCCGYSEIEETNFGDNLNVPQDPIDFSLVSYYPTTNQFGNAVLQERWRDTADYLGYGDYSADVAVQSAATGFHVWVVGRGSTGTRQDSVLVKYVDNAPVITECDPIGFNAGNSTSQYACRAVALEGTSAAKNPYTTGSTLSGSNDWMLALKHRDIDSDQDYCDSVKHWNRLYSADASAGGDEGRSIFVRKVDGQAENFSIWIAGTSAASGNGRDFCVWRFRE